MFFTCLLASEWAFVISRQTGPRFQSTTSLPSRRTLSHDSTSTVSASSVGVIRHQLGTCLQTFCFVSFFTPNSSDEIRCCLPTIKATLAPPNKTLILSTLLPRPGYLSSCRDCLFQIRGQPWARHLPCTSINPHRLGKAQHCALLRAYYRVSVLDLQHLQRIEKLG